MAKILQPCKGCGEQAILLDVGVQVGGVTQNAQMCIKCFTVFMLTQINTGLVVLSERLTGKECLPDCQLYDKRDYNTACVSCIRYPAKPDYYRQQRGLNNLPGGADEKKP